MRTRRESFSLHIDQVIMASEHQHVVLFGYESSPFTWKVRLALRLKQIPYTFVTVPSMMPRTLLRDVFNLTYRKIPVLAIGRELYCDTSIILEALEHVFPDKPSLYPASADGRTNRSLIRGYASYWTDRPLFRVATGLIPGGVWRTHFGTDRSNLIGHKLDAAKLDAKVPRNLVDFDLQFSLMEPQLNEARQDAPATPWIFSTKTPSLADISLFYQLRWARDIAAGRGIADLTGGGTPDTDVDITAPVFNKTRYPATWHWFEKMTAFFEKLSLTETKATGAADAVIEGLRACSLSQSVPTISTPATVHCDLVEKIGLKTGTEVRVAPDDTGRDNPTVGTLVALTPEEIVITPKRLSPSNAKLVDVRVHFPRIGFVVLMSNTARL